MPVVGTATVALTDPTLLVTLAAADPFKEDMCFNAGALGLFVPGPGFFKVLALSAGLEAGRMVDVVTEVDVPGREVPLAVVLGMGLAADEAADGIRLVDVL